MFKTLTSKGAFLGVHIRIFPGRISKSPAGNPSIVSNLFELTMYLRLFEEQSTQHHTIKANINYETTSLASHMYTSLREEGSGDNSILKLWRYQEFLLPEINNYYITYHGNCILTWLNPWLG